VLVATGPGSRRGRDGLRQASRRRRDGLRWQSRRRRDGLLAVGLFILVFILVFIVADIFCSVQCQRWRVSNLRTYASFPLSSSLSWTLAWSSLA
jgi:predicted anti-sigma-YlaC factor YlaD